MALLINIGGALLAAFFINNVLDTPNDTAILLRGGVYYPMKRYSVKMDILFINTVCGLFMTNMIS